jgi:hypothetical protein
MTVAIYCYYCPYNILGSGTFVPISEQIFQQTEYYNILHITEWPNGICLW